MSDQARDREHRLEVTLVLCATVLPAIVNAVAVLVRCVRDREGAAPPRGPDPIVETTYWIASAAWVATWIAVYALVVGRSGEPARAFGLVRRPRALDLLLAAALYFAHAGIYRLAPLLLRSCFDVTEWPVPQDSQATHMTLPGTCAFVVAMLVNAISEELVLRSYLLTRLEQIFRSTPLAVLASSAVFALYHLHQGPLSALCIGCTGILLGFVFAWRRSIWPVALAHIALDLAYA